jgi:membrane associated rhomboid family serine protease
MWPNASALPEGCRMRLLEILAGLIVAAIVYAVFKLLGVVIHIAIIGAVIGFIAGLGITWMIRSRSSS